MYPVASVIDRRGRGWLCRLERQAAWLTPDLNGTLPVVAMVVVEYPAQTDLYGLTGNGTLVGSTLRHGPDVSTAPTPWSPLGGQALAWLGRVDQLAAQGRLWRLPTGNPDLARADASGALTDVLAWAEESGRHRRIEVTAP